MYMDEYKRWMEAELEDFDLKAELQTIEGDEDAIADRFAVALKFGTAGLRGTLGAGTNRMNIWVVRQATPVSRAGTSRKPRPASSPPTASKSASMTR